MLLTWVAMVKETIATNLGIQAASVLTVKCR
jgi:hypothetical protein